MNMKTSRHCGWFKYLGQFFHFTCNATQSNLNNFRETTAKANEFWCRTRGHFDICNALFLFVTYLTNEHDKCRLWSFLCPITFSTNSANLWYMKLTLAENCEIFYQSVINPLTVPLFNIGLPFFHQTQSN